MIVHYGAPSGPGTGRRFDPEIGERFDEYERLLPNFEQRALPGPAVGTRSVSVEIYEDDLRRVVGAPPGAAVLVVGGNSGEPARITVTWKETP